MSLTAVRALRDLGHDFVHLEELGLRTIADAEIFRRAREEQRIVLTFDLDLANMSAASSEPFPSVIIFRLRRGRPARVLARLAAVILSAPNALESGALIMVDEARIRVRPLPLTR